MPMNPMTMKPHHEQQPTGPASDPDSSMGRILQPRGERRVQPSRTLLDGERTGREEKSRAPIACTRWVASSVVLLTLASCASLSVKRDTETSGTFNSSARSFTLFSYSIPRPAAQIAHENIADAGLPNTHATRVTRTDWGWFDWVLEIISIRSARVKGTWGFNGESLGLSPDDAFGRESR